jgi:hypothetical protein
MFQSFVDFNQALQVNDEIVKCLELGNDRFLLNRFQFTIHLPFHHSTIHNEIFSALLNNP